MKLHNTLTKQTTKFAPLDSKTARIYSCGPTVYNHAHIGNLSAYIYADILRRAVRLAGYQTKHVMNFTDVDDKTIRDSKADYPELEPMAALQQLTDKYEAIFLDEMQQVGNDTDSITFVKATDNIAKIQAQVTKLVDSGVAYLADDGIYFSIAKYAADHCYGQLSHINPADISRERVANDEYDKASISDFAIWKKQKPGEPAWDFTVNGQDYTGRPGWHIECSVMSTDNLGQPFDIHTGGVDLIFPHHENEIAQSTAGDQPAEYAKYFVHNEHLLIDGHKMSKSAHNFYTLPDLIKRGFSGLDFRMLVLQSHYSSATNFSWDGLTAARNRRDNWRRCAELRWQLPDTADRSAVSASVDHLLAQAKTALLNNLDTPATLYALDQAMNLLTPAHFSSTALLRILEFIDCYLGMELQATTPDLEDDLKDLIATRQTARQTKNWALSDQLRDQLSAQGVTVLDGAGASVWHRI